MAAMVELGKYSNDELYNELKRRCGVVVAMYTDDDAALALEEQGIEATDEALDYMFKYAVADAMFDEGWEVLTYAAQEYEKLINKED